MEEPPNPVVNLEERHPLQNQVILKIIFDLLESSATLEDWKNIRLVSKLWQSETLSRWRSQAVLDLVQETPFFQPGFQKLTASDLLIHLLNPNGPYKLGEKPYQKYKLQDQTISLPFCDGGLTTASVFWSTVGPWMKNLILTKVQFESRDEEVSELLGFLIDKTPNLEQVTFDTLVLDGIEMAELPRDGHNLECTSVVSLTCRDSYLYPFSCFPNLQKVRLKCGNPIDFTKLVFPDFPATSDHNPLQNSKLTHLDLMNCFVVYRPDGRFNNIHFPSLEHLSLTLNSPWAPYLSDDQRDNLFGPRMIANHRETLKELKSFCWLPPRFGDWAIRYPMPVLSKLFLWGNCMDNLDFLRFTPNLTLLHIDLYGFAKQEEMKKLLKVWCMVTRRAYIPTPTEDKVEASRLSGNLAGVVLPKLEYFQFNYKVGSESARALGEWMPNLKVFKCVLDSSTLPIVCEVWPKLEKLHCLFGSEIVDENVMGSVNGGYEKGVADLKYLRSFHYNSECNRSSLGDKSVEQGFLKMKELTDLQICVSKDFSRESEDALTSRIQNVKVYRNYTENENHADWKCCLDMEYLEYISNYQPQPPREVIIHPHVISLSSDSDSDD